MSRKPIVAAILLAALAGAANAAQPEPVRVEAVQYPAWLERGGTRVPLEPGIRLQGKDRLLTGSAARARIRFADGSTVKLGENARFEIEQAREVGLLRASLRVVSGAFRYATDSFRPGLRRDVTIRARSLTIGIRGTDLWGKSTDERDLVCLIEGVITAGADGHPSVRMDQPLDFYEAPRGAPPSLAKVDAAKLAQWALETEMEKDGPVAGVEGTWKVTAATFAGRDAALALRRTLRARGYPAQVQAEAAGPFVVRIDGLAGEAEARALMQALRPIEGVDNPSVHR